MQKVMLTCEYLQLESDDGNHYYQKLPGQFETMIP